MVVERVSYRGARFEGADFAGASFRDSDLSGIKIVDSWLGDARVSGEHTSVVVDDVDVTAFVSAELDRRHPERVAVRRVRSADDHRAAWVVLSRSWAETVQRARQLPATLLDERVDDEWSFVETLRHLVFATDAWIGRCVLDDPEPYSPLGRPSTGYPPAEAVALGLEPGARPSLDEVLAARAARQALVSRVLHELTDGELSRTCASRPAPGYPDEVRTVGRCLRVVLREECEHHRYAVRDLAVLEARREQRDDPPGG